MSALATRPALTLPQLARMAGGDLVLRALPADPTARESLLKSGVDGVSIDSRAIREGELFVPLRGSRADGHRFLADAFARGAGAALCERSAYPEWEGHEPGPLVVVDDATGALQQLARHWRESWTGLLVGITGSAGKTTTRDLVAAVLATAGPTLATEGNLNNHWGVPLTLLRLRPEQRFAVIEMAMNAAGEIAGLASISRPDAGIITNVGRAHLGGAGLGTVETVAREKAALAFALPKGAPLFAGADSPPLRAALEGAACRVVLYGFAADADVRPRRIEARGREGTRFEVEGFPPVRLRIPGRHMVQNALAALAVARELALDPAAAAAAIAMVEPMHGRMEVRASGGATLLLDHYNANPDSMRAALDTLAAWPDAARRIAILGDMLELGPDAAGLHREIGGAVEHAELWVVGTHAGDYAAGARIASVPVRVFPDKASLGAALRQTVGEGVVVLLKASRGAALEDVLAGLEVEG